MFSGFLTWFGIAWRAVTFIVTVPLMYPFARLTRRSTNPWVISGHRGRLHADNAGALHRFLVTETSQDVIWLSASHSAAEVPGAVLRRGSLKARWAILRAPVLIYSHGEDDLDPLLILLRRLLGLRVYLNHSMNHLKAGQMYRADLAAAGTLKRAVMAWTFVDFDMLLASSERERENFALSFPSKVERLTLGGGAHLDTILKRNDGAPSRAIYYLPTWRDTASGRSALGRTLQTLLNHQELRQWLLDEGLEFRIGAHINSPELASAGLTFEAPFVRRDMATVIEDLTSAAIFISDYSGLLFDYLAMDRPLVYFPFDLDAYLKTRRLYVDYREMATGPIVVDVDELVGVLMSGSFQGEEWAQRRAQWRQICIPSLEPGYAAAGYNAILSALGERS